MITLAIIGNKRYNMSDGNHGGYGVFLSAAAVTVSEKEYCQEETDGTKNIYGNSPVVFIEQRES
jgi:hypothetical protein